jgi:hypothetical protein
VPGIPTDTKWFGSALAVGHFDADPYADLAIGSPWRTTGGSVVVLRGTEAGLSVIGAQSWSQASPGVPGSAERGDAFGGSLASADYGRSGRDDLVIGNLHEDIGGSRDAGAVNVLYGRAAGLSVRHAQRWSQRSPGVQGTAEDGDWFGWSLTP